MASWLRQAWISGGEAAVRAGAVDGAGNSLLAGRFQGTLSWGQASATSAQATAAVIAKADDTGTPAWLFAAVPETAESWVEASALAADANGELIVAGAFCGAFTVSGQNVSTNSPQGLWIAKVDALGNLLWVEAFGTTDGRATPWSVAIAPNGRVALVGSHDGGTDFGGGPLGTTGKPGMFVVTLNAAGAYLDGADHGDGQWPAAAAFTLAGDLVLAGSLGGTLSFGQTSLTSAGLSSGSPDIFLAKLNAAGQPLWSQRRGGGMTHTLSALAVDPNTSDIVVSGWFAGALDLNGVSLQSRASRAAFVARFDSAGIPLWAHTWGDEQAYATAVAFDANGGVLVGGSFEGSMDLGAELTGPADERRLWLARLDATEGVLWAKQSSGAGIAGLHAAAFDDDGDVRLAVSFVGGVDLDDLVTDPSEQPSFFAARIQG